jgi:diphosphomevalonate decarboxylase
MPAPLEITVEAPINIALIKYWGKTDETLILPCNSSLSMTLESPLLKSKTTVQADENFTQDTFELNGRTEVVTPRIAGSISQARSFARRINHFASNWKLAIKSQNTVPTASGLASSASGLAALAFALIKAFGLDEHFNFEDLAIIARVGSGSACRSLFGGFVNWSIDGSVRQIETARFWPDLKGFVVVFSSAAKAVTSTAGMQATVNTSMLFLSRTQEIVPRRMKQMVSAIKIRDFETMAILTMKDSNCFHACCLDTWPPISYLSQASFSLIRAVHDFNSQAGCIEIGYTFDAGQNGVIFGVNAEALDKFKVSLSIESIEQVIPFTIGDGPRIIK